MIPSRRLASHGTKCGLVASFALFALGVAAAQTPPQRLPRQTAPVTAAVQGILRNALGQGLGGVQISLRNTATGQTREALTSGDGVFRLLDLAPGDYQLSARLTGFEPLERTEVKLQPGDVFNLEAILKMLPEPVEPTPPPPETAPLSDRVLPQPVTIEPLPPADQLPPRDNVFSPMPARWEYQFPAYRRYNENGEYPYVRGRWYDPFNRNKLKGDYPLFGNRTFFNMTLISDTFFDGRRLPTPSGVSSEDPDSRQFFGQFGQYFMSENLTFSFDLFRGDAAFRPIDWRIRVTPEVNINYLAAKELGIVNIDVRKGTTRLDAHLGLQEAFVEVKLRDLTHAYDFVSARAGIQSFNSDFRGFIFNDQEPGLRIFGNLRSNRYQYNAVYFAMLEKDTNSGLNRLDYRNQQVFIANLYRQDFFKPGYTIQVSFHYDKDDPTFKFDANNFLVRPAPIGNVKPHSIRAYYYGLTGDGHIGRLNLTHAFYQVLGHDSFNPIAGRRVGINAQMAAAELSIDKDWLRLRASFFYASGDKKPRDGTARGFDAIFDNPNFVGGFFSFWNREGIRLTSTGVALVAPGSLIPSLRSSKIQGQANFVNPGLFVYNAGLDVEITPKLRGFANLNLIRFDRTAPLELVLFQKPIRAGVGADSGLGVTYRPPLTDNIVITGGVNAFTPFRGFKDIYTGQTLLSVFGNVRFQF
jgi:hypothetical protein